MFRKVFAWVLVVVFLMAGFMCFRPNNLLHAHSRTRWEEGMDRTRRYPGRRRRRRRRQVQQEERMEQAPVPGDEDEVSGGSSCAAAPTAGAEGSISAST
ncbi:hypothetical protein SETIT_4G052000v2 [Setaria italica]|uniref:Uncharacterized protein n=1 Tax=Setaria italica TaxID=4555 RepID=K3Y4A4_SETIT|nr:hypothetical protein SETIT_4G052000v2 [Setaria italica]